MSLVSFRPILRPFTVPSAAPVVETKDRDGKGRVRHEVNSHSVKTMETFSYFNSSMWTPKHDGWTWNSCCNSLHKIFATRLQGFSPTQPQEHEWGRPPMVGDAGWRGLACSSSQKVLAVKIEALRRPVTVLPTKLRTVATKLFKYQRVLWRWDFLMGRAQNITETATDQKKRLLAILYFCI